ncbi:HET-domain-containing protein [Lentithecium fluviatile CBS 122367]|uniref:HET-domain-containing protein n=1 Tax=Lentithecium fluviatile CBS 122367 TaxID=1168545 RepID=A0A6G1IKF2_9PLEO|nr:HET-domain-containing protein [Lentithecium fluviatile CBS 122367]
MGLREYEFGYSWDLPLYYEQIEHSMVQLDGISEQQASFHDPIAHRGKLTWNHQVHPSECLLLRPMRCLRCALHLRAYKMIYDGNAEGNTYFTYFGRGQLRARRDTDENFEIFYTPSSSTLENFAKQIRACLDQHTLCGRQEAQPLPTRLIDFRDPTCVRLRETRGATGRYAALSYCWGKSQNLTTTRATYLRHTEGILWVDLPKTFQDALDFCRKLDIDLIWIDSLCIIQDSLDDWEIESAKMGDVYSNAFVVVAADASSDSSGGYYRYQHVPNYRIAQVQKNGISVDIFARKVWNHLAVVYPRHTTRGNPIGNDDTPPLLRRAWAFQERLMASRIIHFTDNEIMWECREHATCECTGWMKQSGDPEVSSGFLANRNTIKKSYTFLSTSTGGSSNDYLWGWHNTVKEYTMLALTNPTDKLPALSGISAKLDRKLLGRFYAGLWEYFFTGWLCWHVQATVPPRGSYWKPFMVMV